ncbi:MAG: glycoside hydrolase family 43 protein [Faecalibacterium sp.]|nr:glycoside hydrolase family 43 protein [Ruminococcus sp.]MCM1392164.1 glycoside hydrolase family 43 protein [Ruminococcus sp.]MCM1486032.1 glycoside hydrolase family 43 protein [Faecalibacterium sp.]
MKLSDIKRITALVLAVLSAFVAILKAAGVLNYTQPVESQEGKYLFCYFVGNDPTEERIHLAVSEDGYNFKALNNNEPIITQTLGKQCVRDPYILRGEDGYYYIIGTDMRCEEGWTSNHALITWKSADLINWTDETLIDIRDFGGEFADTNRAWAPQAIWDADKQQYMVYWAHSTFSNDIAQMYYAYTSDFKTLSEPQPLYYHVGFQTIDADIIYNEKNGKYYLYFKDDEDQTIAYVTSDSLTGPYEDTPVKVSLAPSGVEGSSMYNITGTDTWVMIMDEYSKNRFFAQQTTDMENFSKLPRYTYNFSVNPRHGSVLAITDAEYDALVKAYGVSK